MKIKYILKTLLVFTICVFLKINLTFGQNTEIIGFSIDSGNTAALVKYDYISQNYDTLRNLPGQFYFLGEESSIDFFNGRYFFGGSLTGYPSYSIFSYDIYNDSLKPLFQINFGEEQGIEYDCFTNSIIYRNNDSLKRFDIATESISSICRIPYSDCGMLFGGFKRAYNYLFQRYLYITDLTGNFDMYYVLLDANNGTVIDTTYISNSSSIYLTYDIFTNSFYGLTGNGSVSKINPINGTFTHTSLPPADFQGIANEQDAVFNSFTGQYILPYYSTSDSFKLAMVNVHDSIICQITSFPKNTNFHRLFLMQIPILKIQNNSIIASYGSNYFWYLNNTLVSGLNTQSIIPTTAGYYKVREMFLDGRFAFSDSIYFNPLAIENNTLAQENNLFFPNPFSESTTLKLNKNYSNSELTIYNLMGQEIKKIKNIADNVVKFDRKNINAGIYYYELKQASKNISTGKLIIID